MDNYIQDFCITYDKNTSELLTLCTEILNGCTAYENAIFIDSYLSKYTLDHEIQLLIGNESIIGTIKDAIVGFVKWLWDKLKLLANAIYELFCGSKREPSADSSPRELCVLMMGSQSSFNKAISFMKERIKNSRIKVTSNCDLALLANDFEKFNNVDGMLTRFATSENYNFKDSVDNVTKYVESVLNRLSQHDKYHIQVDRALNYFFQISAMIFKMKTNAVATRELLNQVVSKPIKNKELSPEEAQEYVQHFNKVFGVHGADNQTTDSIKNTISYIRHVVASVFKMDRAFHPTAVSLVTQFFNSQKLDVSSFYRSNGIEIKIPLPDSVQTKLSKLWKTPVRIKRIVVTNTRGLWSTTAMGIAANTAVNKGAPSVEVYINATFFVSDSVCRELLEEITLRIYNEYGSEGVMSDALMDAVRSSNQDRKLLFLNMVIHETRHCFQSQYGKLIDKVVVPGVNGSGKEYNEASHEIDARDAAKQYVAQATSEDIDWVESVLGRLIAAQFKR